MVPRAAPHPGHHETFVGEIYEAPCTCASGHANFYIRHKNFADHPDFLGVDGGTRRWEMPGTNIKNITAAQLEAHYT